MTLPPLKLGYSFNFRLLEVCVRFSGMGTLNITNALNKCEEASLWCHIGILQMYIRVSVCVCVGVCLCLWVCLYE